MKILLLQISLLLNWAAFTELFQWKRIHRDYRSEMGIFYSLGSSDNITRDHW